MAPIEIKAVIVDDDGVAHRVIMVMQNYVTVCTRRRLGGALVFRGDGNFVDATCLACIGDTGTGYVAID